MEAKNKSSYIDTIYLAVGEAIISLLITLIYTALSKFDWTVLSGAVLGSTVTVINFLILSFSVNKALNKYIELRGDKEMTEDEAEKFAKTNSIKVQNAVTKSYIFRTALMMSALVLSLITGYFDTIATIIPLIMYKPLLYAIQFVKKKRGE